MFLAFPNCWLGWQAGGESGHLSKQKQVNEGDVKFTPIVRSSDQVPGAWVVGPSLGGTRKAPGTSCNLESFFSLKSLATKLQKRPHFVKYEVQRPWRGLVILESRQQALGSDVPYGDLASGRVQLLFLQRPSTVGWATSSPTDHAIAQ